MLKWMMKSFLGRISLAGIIVAGIYLALFAPDSVTDAIRSIAEWFLLKWGIGIVTAAFWILGFLIMLGRWPRVLLHRWRVVVGSLGLVFAAQGVLSNFEGYLPLVGYYQLGGSIGSEIQGEIPFVDHLRVVALGGLSFWIFLPQTLGNSVLARLIRSLRALLKMVFLVLRWAIKSLFLTSRTGTGRNRNKRDTSPHGQEIMGHSILSNAEEPSHSLLKLSKGSTAVLKPAPRLTSKDSESELPSAPKMEVP